MTDMTTTTTAKPEAKADAKAGTEVTTSKGSESGAEAKADAKAGTEVSSSTGSESGAEAKRPTSDAPAGYSRGENQKLVTDAYRNNWDNIFGKKPRGESST